MPVQPYLFFEGRCEEAADFYRQAIGGEIVMLMRMKESPEPHPEGMLPPGSDNKILHMTLRLGGTELMASDGHCSGSPSFKGFSLSHAVTTVEEAQASFAKLADGGQVNMPLSKTFFSPSFGMLTDRFGVQWMVMCQP